MLPMYDIIRFANPVSYLLINALPGKKCPTAVHVTTGKNPEMGGVMVPCPIFDNGNFNIPSAYMTDTE